MILLSEEFILYYLGALQIVWVTSSPNSIIEGIRKNLTCVFSGWPLPRTVYWYKDDQLINNGTEGIYYSENKKWKNGEDAFHSTLHLPTGREKQEGIYNCRATNSLPGWSSSASEVIQMIYECKLYNYSNSLSLKLKVLSHKILTKKIAMLLEISYGSDLQDESKWVRKITVGKTHNAAWTVNKWEKAK